MQHHSSFTCKVAGCCRRHLVSCVFQCSRSLLKKTLLHTCDSCGVLPGPPLVFPMIWIKALFYWKKKTKSKNTCYFCACGLCCIKWNVCLLHLYLGQSLVSMVATKRSYNKTLTDFYIAAIMARNRWVNTSTHMHPVILIKVPESRCFSVPHVSLWRLSLNGTYWIKLIAPVPTGNFLSVWVLSKRPISAKNYWHSR